jgi:NTP pyrophosphatase (non-canonical NTP hydrolase)
MKTTVSKVMFKAIRDVVDERKRQDKKWGEQNHAPMVWIPILVEEVGEFSEEALADHFAGTRTANLRIEAVQVAAVALAIIECIDRNPNGVI